MSDMCCRSTRWSWFGGHGNVWHVVSQKYLMILINSLRGHVNHLMSDMLCHRSTWWSWFGGCVKGVAACPSPMWWPSPPWWKHPNSLPLSGEMLTPQVTPYLSFFICWLQVTTFYFSFLIWCPSGNSILLLFLQMVTPQVTPFYVSFFIWWLFR